MNDNDSIQRFLFEEFPIRGELVRLETSYQAIINQHSYSGPARLLLGEALTVISLLSSIIKFKGRLTLQFQGKGAIKLLLAQCNQQMQLRGLIQGNQALKSDEIGAALKDGTLAILMDPDITGGQRYQGIVAWHGETLAESIEHYFQQSEQLATRIILAVDESRAAGLLLQTMPEDHSKQYQENWQHLLHITDTLNSNELLTLENEVLLHRLYHEEDIRIFASQPIEFKCNCSLARSEKAVLLLGIDEINAELVEKQKIVVTCEFCNREFIFDRVDIARIFKQNDLSSPLH